MFLEGAMVYGFGRRLMFIMSWVRIPAPDTRWTFFHICRKNYFFCSKRPKITKKRQRMTYLKMFWSEDNNNSRWQKRKKVSSSNSRTVNFKLTLNLFFSSPPSMHFKSRKLRHLFERSFKFPESTTRQKLNFCWKQTTSVICPKFKFWRLMHETRVHLYGLKGAVESFSISRSVYFLK